MSGSSSSPKIPSQPLDLSDAEMLEVGEEMMKNVYKGKLTGEFLVEPEDVTIFKFHSKEIATTFIKQLQREKDCPFVVKIRSIKKFDQKRKRMAWGVYVVTEPLILFNDGMTRLFDEKDMYCWKVDNTKTNTLRLGDGPRQIFSQVGKVLYRLNEKYLFSNNISEKLLQDNACDGLWFGYDLNVRLCKFKCEETDFFTPLSTIERKNKAEERLKEKKKFEKEMEHWRFDCIKRDLKQYTELVEYVVKKNKPSTSFRTRVFPSANALEVLFPHRTGNNLELEAFLNCYTTHTVGFFDYNNPGTLVKRHCKCVYDSPISWRLAKHAYFFQRLNEVMRFKKSAFSNLFQNLNGWDVFFRSQHDIMKSVLTHEFENEGTKYVYNKGQGGDYEKNYGIVKFIINYMKHYNDSDSFTWGKGNERTEFCLFQEIFHLIPFITGLAHQYVHQELVMDTHVDTATYGWDTLRNILEKEIARFSS